MKKLSFFIALLLLFSSALFAQMGINADNNTPDVCGQPFTDARDGKVYTTVSIGSQCWMAENLNVGVRIDGFQDQANNSIIEKYCYNDDNTNCNTYGALYQWNEAMQYLTTPGVQGICPTGWHLPSDAEWTALTDFLGGESIAGGKMKETGTAHWLYPNTGATNSSGFTALPGGNRDNNGYFVNLTTTASFWSSTEYSSTRAWHRHLYYDNEGVTRCYYNTKADGFSARCVHD